MLPTLLVTAAIAGSTIDARAQVERPAALELVVYVQDSRLSLFNPTEAPELVVLTDRENGSRATLVVPAQGDFEFSFGARALDGIDFTVFARERDGLRASQTVSFDELRGLYDDQATLFQSCDEHVHAWTYSQSGWSPLLPNNGPVGTPQCATMLRPMHVPVITPHDNQHGNLPPRIEKKPLPAV